MSVAQVLVTRSRTPSDRLREIADEIDQDAARMRVAQLEAPATLQRIGWGRRDASYGRRWLVRTSEPPEGDPFEWTELWALLGPGEGVE